MEKSTQEKQVCHLIYIPFTGLGKINRGDKWLANRIQVFKEYVLRSLLAQTKKEFIIWVSWRPEDRDNPMVQDLFELMKGLDGLRTIFTFAGLCFYDDKYNKDEALERLYDNLGETLPALVPYVDWADEVYMTINASDDMYISSAVDTIQNEKFDTKAIGWTKGYIIDYATKRTAEYNPDTIPPFFTIRFPKDIFIDPFEHMKYTKSYQSHEYIKDLGFKELEGRGFVVGTHSENISTTWNIPYKGEEVDNSKVLLLTGNYWTEPIVMKPSKRVILRKIYNKLPCKKLIKLIYKSL
jgi:hypothetical protein